MFVLGQEQDERGGLFSAREAFVGSMSRFNIWDTVISAEEIQQIGEQWKYNIKNTLKRINKV